MVAQEEGEEAGADSKKAGSVRFVEWHGKRGRESGDSETCQAAAERRKDQEGTQAELGKWKERDEKMLVVKGSGSERVTKFLRITIEILSAIVGSIGMAFAIGALIRSILKAFLAGWQWV